MKQTRDATHQAPRWWWPISCPNPTWQERLTWMRDVSIFSGNLKHGMDPHWPCGNCSCLPEEFFNRTGAFGAAAGSWRAFGALELVLLRSSCCPVGRSPVTPGHPGFWPLLSLICLVWLFFSSFCSDICVLLSSYCFVWLFWLLRPFCHSMMCGWVVCFLAGVREGRAGQGWCWCRASPRNLFIYCCLVVWTLFFAAWLWELCS